MTELPLRVATVPVSPRGVTPDIGVIERYLPSNYWAEEQTDGSVKISGHDSAGWTLDGYVIPRLASGLIFATESN